MIQGSPTVIGNYKVIVYADLANQRTVNITLNISIYQESEIFYYTQYSSLILIPNQYYYIPLISDIHKLKSNSFIIKQIPNGLKFDNNNGMISGSVNSASSYFVSTLYYSDYPKYYTNTTIILGNTIKENENENANSGIFVNYIEIDRNIHRCDKRMNIRELKIMNQDILNEMKEERDDLLYGSYYEFYLVMKESKNIEFQLSSYGNSIMYIDEYENEIMSTRSCDYNYERREMRLESGKHYIRIEYYPSTYKYEIKLEMTNKNGEKKEYKVLNNENCIMYGGIISNVKYEEMTVNKDSFIFSKPEILSGNVIQYRIKNKTPNGLNIDSKSGIISGILEKCIESIEIEVICIGISNSIESRLIIHCYDNNNLDNDYSMEIRKIQDDIYDKTMKLNSFIHNPVIFKSDSIKNNNISLNGINVNLSNNSFVIKYEGIIEKEIMQEIKTINVVGKYERMKMIITNEREYSYDNNIDKELFKNLSMNMKSEYNSNIKIIINVKNIKDFKSISMKVNMKMNLLSILKRISINSFHYPCKYCAFYLMRSISPILSDELLKSISDNNNFKFKITPSLPAHILFDENTGTIYLNSFGGLNLFRYNQFTITMYNNEISYSNTIYIRYLYHVPVVTNMNQDFVMRNDRFYYPVEIEGIYSSCSVKDNSKSLSVVDGCVLSGYVNHLYKEEFTVFNIDRIFAINFRIDDKACHTNMFIVIVDILDLETNIEVDIYDKNKVIINEQIFNHSYMSMNLCLYEGSYYLSYKILNYDEERIYNNTITYGVSNFNYDGIVLNEIDASSEYEMIQFNIPYNNEMIFWYDPIVFTNENAKYIDLYPHLNNPYTYEMNPEKFMWKIYENPESLKINKSNGRVYGYMAYKDKVSVDLFYEEEDFSCFRYLNNIYNCIYDSSYTIDLFNNYTTTCENGYYGNQIYKCFYLEDSDNTKLDIVDNSDCKEVKSKPSNKNEVIIIMSFTIHLNKKFFFEYEESFIINSRIIRNITSNKEEYGINIYEVSVLSNEKHFESENVTITVQYTTVKEDVEESIERVKAFFCLERRSTQTFEYYFENRPFSLVYVEKIEYPSSNNLYLYIGIIGGIVGCLIIIVVIVLVYRCLIYKKYKEKVKCFNKNRKI